MHMINSDPCMRPNSQQILSFFTAHLDIRNQHIYVNEIVGSFKYCRYFMYVFQKNKLLDAFFTTYVFILAIIEAFKDIFYSYGSAIFAKHQPVPRTPVTTRMTVPNIDWDFNDNG